MKESETIRLSICKELSQNSNTQKTEILSKVEMTKEANGNGKVVIGGVVISDDSDSLYILALSTIDGSFIDGFMIGSQIFIDLKHTYNGLYGLVIMAPLDEKTTSD
ncbi:hypothetical protein [Candidatus Stoquefichus massiliensis]|uniref:hypothetical protein n=1 Tax=Candidatus Stoquefichus massiliensis TaxID=1470350 RepID=UPI0004866C66|nr:hypothetical protein [Candidatus Stoquefichus massiliensis]